MTVRRLTSASGREQTPRMRPGLVIAVAIASTAADLTRAVAALVVATRDPDSPKGSAEHARLDR